MLKTKIKISEVSNLTDARYFAAWGVDYLGYVIHPDHPRFISPPDLKEITEWIEGPHVILETHENMDPMWLGNYAEVIGDYFLQSENEADQPDFLILRDIHTPVKDQESFVIFQSDKTWKDIKEDVMILLDRLPNPVFLDCGFGTANLDDILSANLEGLVLRGGDEEKIGVKSYDDLDELFDFLID